MATTHTTTERPPDRVVVVEDNDGLRGLIVKALVKAGVETIGVATGAEAIEQLTVTPDAALLVDQELPDMLGSDVVRGLRERGVQVPFVMMTGQGDERLAVEVMKLGAADYLVKDLDLSDRLPGIFERLFRVRETERRLSAAEDALRAEQARLAALTRSAQDGIVMMDTEGRIEFWNPAAERLLGYTRTEALETDLHGLLSDERHHAAVAKALARFRETGETAVNGKTLETMARRKDGREIPIELSLATMELADGWHAVGILRDITERKRADNDRERLREQLLRAQRMESVGRLAGGVAHDFNNILQTIIGYVEGIIDQAPPTATFREDLQEVLSAAERAAQLTSQLLAFARKQTVSPRVIDLNSEVSELLGTVRQTVGERIRVAWTPAGGLWPVKLDRSQLGTVLTNLCANARDAIANEGRIAIESGNVSVDEAYCATHAEASVGDYVALTVSDDGCGIDSTAMDRLFDPFFTTKDVDKGTGLGLATVHGIVMQNHGFISVYSEVGEGSKFSIYLPRHVGAVRETRPRGPTRPLPRGSETILIAEDEPAILTVCGDVLGRLGYELLLANGPSQALAMADKHDGRIDLLMTDVSMPEMSGCELAEALATARPDMLCLYMSGYTLGMVGNDNVIDEGQQFLQKPFTMRTLAEKIREVLDSAPPARTTG